MNKDLKKNFLAFFEEWTSNWEHTMTFISVTICCSYRFLKNWKMSKLGNFNTKKCLKISFKKKRINKSPHSISIRREWEWLKKQKRIFQKTCEKQTFMISPVIGQINSGGISLDSMNFLCCLFPIQYTQNSLQKFAFDFEMNVWPFSLKNNRK